MKILVTGGCGYIGTHTVVELIASGHDVVVIDNLSNSSEEALKRVEQIVGKKIPLYVADCADRKALDRIFDEHEISAVMHFAGLKSVGESVNKPIAYYFNNINSTLHLIEAMEDHAVRKLIFSSSATVYDPAEPLPWTETSRTGNGIPSPYGQTKFVIEQILRDVCTARPDWQVTTLRYFNPIGAHESGLIGEDPNDIPNNLMPYIAQVAVGRLEKLHIYGNDYDTADGTGVRDYIHAVDLAKGHVAALKHLTKGVNVYNLGSGHGVSVLEALHAFEKAAHKKIPYEIVGRRQGDIAACYADASKAERELGWKTTRTFDQACEDTWRWQSQNPNGYHLAP